MKKHFKKISHFLIVFTMLVIIVSCTVVNAQAAVLYRDSYSGTGTPGGTLQGGIFGRTYNCNITNLENLNGIQDAIADWNWVLNPQNNGTGTDFWFFQSSSSEMSRATIHFTQQAFEFDDVTRAQTLFFLENGTEIMGSQQLSSNNWYRVVIIINENSSIYGNRAAIRNIMNHEIGHALGLAHNITDNGTIMERGRRTFRHWMILLESDSYIRNDGVIYNDKHSA